VVLSDRVPPSHHGVGAARRRGARNAGSHQRAQANPARWHFDSGARTTDRRARNRGPGDGRLAASHLERRSAGCRSGADGARRSAESYGACLLHEHGTSRDGPFRRRLRDECERSRKAQGSHRQYACGRKCCGGMDAGRELSGRRGGAGEDGAHQRGRSFAGARDALSGGKNGARANPAHSRPNRCSIGSHSAQRG
jgi:hypothetical protein